MSEDNEPKMKLEKEIAKLLNIVSRENESNTPDFVLAEYLMACLKAYEVAVQHRDKFGVVQVKKELTDKHIWIHYVDYTGNSDDYAVIGWEAAELEVFNLIKCGLNFVCDGEIRYKIEGLLETDLKTAVELYNEYNDVGEFIACREGKRVYE